MNTLLHSLINTNLLFMRTGTSIVVLISCLPLFAFAQKQPAYPQAYFRNPLDIPIFLAGNFGECRPGHFHSGVDIKTLGKENQPVHAAADGYVSRIKMEKGGFGHALYITHPNGYTTLYAHLNKFSPALQQYMEREQYAARHWDVDLPLSPAQFPVKKGQLIAWSGNTGGSTAPHLHFEIRNTQTEHPLNPQLFGLPILDKRPPVVAEVALYKGSVYDGEPVYLPLVKNDGIYKLARTDQQKFSVNSDTMQVAATVTGIGINVDDYMDGSDNTIAFYTADLYMDDSLQAQVVLDNIGYDETRYINAYADYKTRQQKHAWVQCLFQQSGNHLDNIYRYLNPNKGRIDLTDMRTHKVAISLTDDKGNVSKVQFFLKPIKIPANTPQSDCIPFYANKPNTFSNPNITFDLDQRQLYEDMCFTYKSIPQSKGYSDKYILHTPDVPLHHYFDLMIKPNKPVWVDVRSKMVLMYSDGKDEDGRAVTTTDNGWYKAKVRNFGTYWLDIDTIPPVITSVQKNGANLSKAKQILFEVNDATTSVRKFSGYLDGKWICFEQHTNKFFYNFDAHYPKGKHKLQFKAEDENGNTQTFDLTFTR
ncbi:MAG: metalloendopeptidase [Flavipsychrobacter sp.]|nr:metalloendopeptidase [Flavipsychrobacter sp.]